MLADEVTHVKMGSDWLRRLTAKDPERQKDGPRLPAHRRQAVQLRRLPRRGGGEPGPPRPHVPRAGRLHRGRDHRPRRRRRRGLRRGAGRAEAAAAAARGLTAAGSALLLRDLHVGWAWFVVIGNGLAGRVGARPPTGCPRCGRARCGGSPTVVEVAIFVQVALGVALVAGEELEPPQFHMFYGFVAHHRRRRSSTRYRAQLRDRRYLLYGFGGLFLMGLGIRAMLVGAR